MHLLLELQTKPAYQCPQSASLWGGLIKHTSGLYMNDASLKPSVRILHYWQPNPCIHIV